MSTKNIALISIVLWVGLALFVGFKMVKGSVEIAEDGREVITLTSKERVMILGEMRQLLQAVQTILEGIEKNDTKTIIKGALSGGTAMMLDETPGLMLKLPHSFKTRGINVHTYFDDIAEEAQKGANREKIISMLNTQLKNCIACHVGNQLRTE